MYGILVMLLPSIDLRMAHPPPPPPPLPGLAGALKEEEDNSSGGEEPFGPHLPAG